MANSYELEEETRRWWIWWCKWTREEETIQGSRWRAER
jgi:hypothetical protein